MQKVKGMSRGKLEPLRNEGDAGGLNTNRHSSRSSFNFQLERDWSKALSKDNYQ